MRFTTMRSMNSTFRKTAFGVVSAVTLVTALPASAQQAPAQQTTMIKKMNDADCKATGKLVEYQVEKYPQLSNEFVDDWANYIEKNCVGMVNGKPYQIRIMNKQDDISGAKIQEIAGLGKVTVQDTGVKFVYPKGTPKAPTAPAAKPAQPSKAAPR